MKLLLAVVRPASLAALVATLAVSTSRDVRSGPGGVALREHGPRGSSAARLRRRDGRVRLPEDAAVRRPGPRGIMGWSHGGFITAHLVMAA